MKYTEDPKKPTPKELEAANQFAKRFALRKGLIFGDDATVGDKIPAFIDGLTGKEMVGGQNSLPPRTIMDINKIPSYVKGLMNDENNVPYFIDESTGDIQYVHPDIARSSRFNPNRGRPMAGQMVASNLFGNRFSN